MFRKLSTSVLFLLLGTPLAVMAQGTGTLAGRVTDAADGQGLPGANVVLVGTTLGAATDLDGNYRIIGVPVGDYDVTARFVGYEETTELGVEINSGYTRTIDFELQDDTAALDEIFIVYERPLIQADAIGAPRYISRAEIQSLPVRGVANVASIQSGVVSDDNSDNLFIRGGREQEVQYYVDGVKVSGPIAVNQAAIQEQEMLIGSIPARYGDVQSGIISITTRTGRDRFFGSAEIITSEGLDSYGYNLGSLSLGGPVVPGMVSFFVSGQGILLSDRNPYGVDTYRLTDAAYADLIASPQVLRLFNIDNPEETQYIDFPWQAVQAAINDGDIVDEGVMENILNNAGAIPAGWSLDGFSPVDAPSTYTEATPGLALGRGKDNGIDTYTVNGNLNFNFTNALSLRVGGTYDTFERDNYSFTGGLYNRDKFYLDSQDAYRGFGTFRHRISENAFYQISGEYQNTEFNRRPNGFSDVLTDVILYGDIDDDYNEITRRYFNFSNGVYSPQFTADGGGRPTTVSGGTFSSPGRILSNYQQSHNQQYRISGSATTQQGVHQIEFGGEYEQQTRRFFSVFANSLASFICDDPSAADCGAEQGEGVDGYTDLPFNAMRATGYTYYGYNYLGTAEVDGQNIDAWLEYNPDTDGFDALDVAPFKPIYYAGYFQDKIEFRDLVINLGVRVDVFDANSEVLMDLYAPIPIIRVGDIASGTAPSGAASDWAVYFDDDDAIVGYRDLDGNFFDTEGIRTTNVIVTSGLSGQVERLRDSSGDLVPTSAAFRDYDPEATIMPRVGVSFPVTDRALFFASYNVTTQRPTERAIAPFTFFDQLDGQQSRTPNPALRPEKTTQYELGFRQRLGERAALTLSGFYRTQENKISNRPLFGGLPEYGSYLNKDFTTSKGVELGFDLRRTNNLAIAANYTLSFAQGTGSDAGATAVIVWRGTFFPDTISPADFDQRHTANISLDYRYGQGEGPMLGGTRILENFGINLLGRFGSGQHFTPLTAAGHSVNESFTEDTAGSINSANLPSTSNLDLKIDRTFNLFGQTSAKLYFWVQNVLDTRNVLAVYRATGLPDQDGYLASPEGRGFLNSAPDAAGTAFNYAAYVSGPVNNGGTQSSGGGLFYGGPRRIRVGLLVDF